ncbi:MAG: response regulator [Balneolaceae bacterium]|nr:response regulator [Balneolaceae bacterium]MBO6544987.1 response regulator [Balneolaceae bacterium]MBO6646383.1 response regulator [Balneolaceae bacterium]
MKEDKTVEILLVEDSNHDAELTLRALKKNNITNNIVRLRNGEEALDFIFGRGEYQQRSIKNQPKVVLLDLKMPKVDGMEVLKEIRNNKETENLPVVILTSSKEERDVIESYKLGVNSFIVKPVEFGSFTKAVAEIGFYWVLLNQKP